MNIKKQLTVNELSFMAPSALAQGPCLATTKAKYTFFDTTSLIKSLSDKGFMLYDASQRRLNTKNINSIKRQGYQKHCLTFMNAQDTSLGQGLFKTITCKNSHDGSGSYELILGVYRQVCDNGLIVPATIWASLRITHRRSIEFFELELEKFLSGFFVISEKINAMAGKQLSNDEIKSLYNQAASLRDNDKVKIKNAIELAIPNRTEDSSTDLFTVFNRCQENLLKGNVSVINTTTNKERKARPIKGIDTSIALNQELFELAFKMAA